MTAFVPADAYQAKVQGWHMVCVLPCTTNPAGLLDELKTHFVEVAHLPFTYKGKSFPEGQTALWVWGFRQSPRGRSLLHQALDRNPDLLRRFVLEILGSEEEADTFHRRRGRSYPASSRR